jgi:hypothetical protein
LPEPVHVTERAKHHSRPHFSKDAAAIPKKKIA